MDQWRMESKRFDGQIEFDGYSVLVGFSAGLDQAGAAQFDFEPLPASAEAALIVDRINLPGFEFADFQLSARAADGMELSSDELFFSAYKEAHVAGAISLGLTADCQRAVFRCEAEPKPMPQLRLLVLGLPFGRRLEMDCLLGHVEVDWLSRDRTRAATALSASIQIRPEAAPEDLTAWRARAEELLRYLRSVLSFATGAMLKAPLVEFEFEGVLEIEVLPQSRQTLNSMPPFELSNLTSIFNRAVERYFSPEPLPANFDMAIEWFAMSSGYAEASLIGAMTVLENLVSSNLSDADKAIQSEDNFKRLKARLEAAIKDHSLEVCGDKASQGELRRMVKEKLNDLNRKSLKEKVKLLASRWRVDMEGLGDAEINAAKRARDLIVHQGSYEPVPGKDAHLFAHVVVARELVVRFILAALGYEGEHYSFMGGWGERTNKLAPQVEGEHETCLP